VQINIGGSPGGISDLSQVDAWIRELSQIRDEGFRRMWISQLPWEPDMLTVAAIALREVDEIELATSVLPIQPQHPMYLAQRALTMSLISHGRFTLGLGVSHRLVTEGMWGIPWDRSVRRLNEYLDGLLPLLEGQSADTVGETVTTRGALDIPNVTPPRVFVAALGPQMLRLAGRRSAGTVTWMTGPKTLAGHIGPTLREAASEVGRPDGSVQVAAAFPIFVTDDVDGARAQAAEQFAMYGQLPSYRAMLDREGFAGPEDVALIGDETSVWQRIEELRSSGVDELIAVPFEASVEGRARSRALLRERRSSIEV
jgi:5,10-methylenetetrahydromethanopterin reductase